MSLLPWIVRLARPSSFLAPGRLNCGEKRLGETRLVQVSEVLRRGEKGRQRQLGGGGGHNGAFPRQRGQKMAESLQLRVSLF